MSEVKKFPSAQKAVGVEMSSVRNYSSPSHFKSDSPHLLVAHHADVHEGEPGQSSVLGASFNFVNSIVGAGIIGKLLLPELPRFQYCVLNFGLLPL